MKKDHIIQFVCFITGLDSVEFLPQWEVYAREYEADARHSLLQLESEKKNRYKYISRHECSEDDFRFNFMKGRSSEHFPDQKVKVVQAGGYSLLAGSTLAKRKREELTLMVLLDHNDRDIDFYRQLSSRSSVNAYEAYFESCTYGHILEIYTTEILAPEILSRIVARTGTESALYRTCIVTHA